MPTAETALQPATTTANNRPKTPRQGIMASSPEITQPTRPGGAQCPKTYFNVPGRMRFPRPNDFLMVADVQASARHARNTTSAQKARLARKRPPRSCEAEHVVTGERSTQFPDRSLARNRIGLTARALRSSSFIAWCDLSDIASRRKHRDRQRPALDAALPFASASPQQRRCRVSSSPASTNEKIFRRGRNVYTKMHRLAAHPAARARHGTDDEDSKRQAWFRMTLSSLIALGRRNADDAALLAHVRHQGHVARPGVLPPEALRLSQSTIQDFQVPHDVRPSRR